MPRLLHCTHGHSWESDFPASNPEARCPTCGSAAETLDVSIRPDPTSGAGDPNRTAAHAAGTPGPNFGTLAQSPEDEALARAASASADTGADPARSFPALPHYEILGELGRGGMGVVYKARDTRLKRLVALKMIRAGVDATERDLERFRVEAEAVARVQHPGIVQIHEVGEAGGLPYFSLEFVDGGTLSRKLRGEPLPPRDAAAVVEPLARAVQFAHAHGIVHRDLKPANVLLAADGTPKVTDFGLAKRLDAEDGQTVAGQILGTPSYMAPEQAAGEVDRVGPPADVYALGAILYECLTGRPPFRGSTKWDTIDQVLRQEAVPPSRLQHTVPLDLDTICLKCLEKDPARRYASAEALADDLRRFRAGEPILARPIGSGERFRKWVRRNPTIALMSGAMVAVVAAAFAVTLTQLFAKTEALDNEKSARLVADQKTAAAIESDGKTKVALGEREKALGEKDLALSAKGAALKAEQAATAKAREEAERAERRSAWNATARGFSELANVGSREGGAGGMLQARQKLAEIPPAYREWEQHVLDRLCNKDERRWPGQAMAITAAAVSADGSRVLAATRDDTVHVWDRRTGQKIHTNRGHTEIVQAIAVSPDGVLAASSSARLGSPDNGEVLVWEVATGHFVQRMIGDDGFFRSVAFSPDGKRLALAAGKGVITICDPRTGAALKTIKGQGSNARQIAFSPDGKYLAWTHSDGGIDLWDIGNDRRAGRVERQGPAATPASFAFSPDGKTLAVVWSFFTGQGRGGFWDVAALLKGQTAPTRELPEVASHPQAVAWSGDSRFLATGYADGVVRVWDAEGREKHKLDAHAMTVVAVSFSKDGAVLVSASSDGRVRVWDPAAGTPGIEFTGGRADVRCVVVSPDGKHVATGSGAVGSVTGVEIRDFQTGRVVHGMYEHKLPITGLGYSGNGAKLASCSTDRTVIVWDAATGKRLHTFVNATSRFLCAALDHEGTRALAGDDTGGLHLWSLTDNKLIRKWQAHTSLVSGVAFEPGGTRFASAGYDAIVRVWEPDNPEPVISLKQSGPAPPHVSGATIAWSPDGKWFAAVGRVALLKKEDSDPGDEVSVWTADGKSVVRLTGTNAGINGVSFGPDGTVVMAGAKGRIWVWERAGPSNYGFIGHTGDIMAAAAHPDGKHVVSGGRDGTIRVWHRHRSREAMTFGSAQNQAAIDPAGTRVATAGADGAVRVWDVATGAKVFEGTGHQGRVVHLAFQSPTRLVSTGLIAAVKDGPPAAVELFVWSLDRSGKTVHRKQEGFGGELSPDGRLVVVQTRQERVGVFEVETGDPVCEVPRLPEVGRRVVFNHDGTRLAVTAGPNAVVYEIPAGREVYALRGHGTDVGAVAFSPDRRWLATTSGGYHLAKELPGEIHLWDASSGRRVRTFTGHTRGIGHLAFTPDGKRLVSGSTGQPLRLWDTEAGSPVLELPFGRFRAFGPVEFDRTGRLLVAESDVVRLWDGRPIPNPLPDYAE